MLMRLNRTSKITIAPNTISQLDKIGIKPSRRMLDIEMETEEEYDEYKEHGNPLQHIEVVIQLDQCICGIIIGVEHKQAR